MAEAMNRSAPRILRTTLRVIGGDTVVASRKAVNGFDLLAEACSEVILGGEPQEKPHPDIFGDDHWPDWEKLVARAWKKLIDRHGGKTH